MNQILQGDALAVLRTLPDASIQCCVTSPPYFGLRDYGVEGQIGLEETPEAYVEKLVAVFREVRRVLRDDGVCWINLGDSYASQAGQQVNQTNTSRIGTQEGAWNGKNRKPPNGLKPKDLIGIPWMVAFALRSDGWYLRSDVIWHKPTAMPESVTDRPTTAHEHIFLLAKSERYFYDAQAIAEPSTRPGDIGTYGGQKGRNWIIPITDPNYRNGHEKWGRTVETGTTRNKRTVWTIASQPYSEAHFATFPPKLIEPCILAGSRPGDIVLDCFMGAGTVALVAIQHHRDYLGIELNPAYVKLAEKRIANVQQNLWTDAS